MSGPLDRTNQPDDFWKMVERRAEMLRLATPCAYCHGSGIRLVKDTTYPVDCSWCEGTGKAVGKAA